MDAYFKGLDVDKLGNTEARKHYRYKLQNTQLDIEMYEKLALSDFNAEDGSHRYSEDLQRLYAHQTYLETQLARPSNRL